MTDVQEAPEPDGRDSSKSNLWFWTNVATVILLLLILSTVPIQCIAKKSVANTYASNARQILTGCRSYAADHDGEFPPSLEALRPEYIEEEYFEAIVLNHQLPEKPPAFVYVPGFRDTSPARTPILISKTPIRDDGKEYLIIGYAGGQVESWSRKERERKPEE